MRFCAGWIPGDAQELHRTSAFQTGDLLIISETKRELERWTRHLCHGAILTDQSRLNEAALTIHLFVQLHSLVEVPSLQDVKVDLR